MSPSPYFSDQLQLFPGYTHFKEFFDHAPRWANNLIGFDSAQYAWQPKMTAQQSWDSDQYKNGLLEAEGFDVFTIWEDEENQLEK